MEVQQIAEAQEEDRRSMKILLIITSFFLVTQLAAQNEADIFRYSKTYHSGSARFEAMGGAFGALGGDLSAGQINPGGMGRFSNSQFSFSLGPTINASSGEFMSNSTNAIKTSFSIPNFGVVFTKDVSGKNKGNLYSQFSFGMNRIANFNQRLSYSGEQFESLLDVYGNQAAGTPPNDAYIFFPFTTGVAYDAYALEFDPATNTYYSYLNSGNMLHSRDIETKGGINEWYLSYSANRMNKLYWGASINLRDSKYIEKYTHREEMTDTVGTIFRSFDYQYDLKTTGLGVNLKIGAIYLVTDAFRIGASFHSPTFTQFKDDYSANMTSTFRDSTKTIPEEFVPIGKYQYNMNTPLKLTASAAYIFGLRGLVSFDVDYIGYNMGRLRSTKSVAYEPYDFKEENNVAKERLTAGFNYRAGVEFNIQQKLFIRGGFSLYSNAFKKEYNVDSKADIAFSGGLGYKINQFSIDISYVNRTINRTYYAFENSSADFRTVSNVITITGSIRF